MLKFRMGATTTALTLVMAALNAAAESERRPVPDPIQHVLKRLNECEAAYNVKCAATFEAAVDSLAGRPLSRPALTGRGEIVSRFTQDLLEQLSLLSNINGGKAASPDMVRTALDSVVYMGIEDGGGPDPAQWLLHMATGPPVRVLRSDLDTERRLSDSWRMMFSVLQRRSDLNSGLRVDGDALEEAAKVISFYQLALINLAAGESRARGASEIGPQDLREADKLLRTDLKDIFSMGGEPPPLSVPREGWIAFNSISFIRSKIKALELVNASLSPGAVREHWGLLAGIPLSTAAFSAVLDETLPAIGRLIWRRAQDQLTEDIPMVTAAAMAGAISQLFPYRTDEEENVEYFPGTEASVRVLAFEGDSIRDDAVHWRTLLKLMEDGLGTRSRPSPAGLWAPLDPYAADELSELLSTFLPALLKTSVSFAGRGPKLEILPSHVRKAEAHYLQWARRKRAGPRLPEAPAAPVGPAPPGPYFVDVTSGSGLRARAAPPRPSGFAFDKEILGFAILDFDRDGWPDIFLCDHNKSRLYRNIGKFRFSERPTAIRSDCKGASSADFDNDGWPDLLVLGSGKRDRQAPRLFHNKAGLDFEEVASFTALSTAPLPAFSAVWLDFDRDGLLDLYILVEGEEGRGVKPTLGDAKNGLPNRLYRNEGKGFRDVTQSAGVGDTGWGAAGAVLDFDNDGLSDIYVNNDFGRSLLYRNKGDGTFEDVGRRAGVDSFGHGMGVSIADVDRDGLMDILVTNIGVYNPGTRYIRPTAHTPLQYSIPLERNIRAREANRLYLNLGGGRFEDVYDRLTAGPPTGFGWSGMFLDFDNDGYDDIYMVNGLSPFSILHNSERKVLLRWDTRAGRFQDVSARSGADFRGNSRSCGFADFDRDGRLDIFVLGLEGLRLLRNVTRAGNNHWVTLRLIGTRSARDAVGARITLSAGTWRRHAQVGGGGGGTSGSSEGIVHFGLGGQDNISELEIQWPSGTVSRARGLAADLLWELREDGDPVAMRPFRLSSRDQEAIQAP